jgi:low temperature requirement protein LtrA
MFGQLVRPLRLRTLDPQEEHRVTWLELFFDLVFVAAVAQVGTPLGEDYSASGLLRFTLLFLMIWWAWLGHSTFSTRFDTDDLVQRALTLLQMFCVAVMAVNAKDALDSRESAGFAAAYAAMRFVLVAQYARARRLQESRPLSTEYLAGAGSAAVLWLVSAVAPVPARFWLWAVAFLIDGATPLLAERHSVSIPPDKAHLPERYGLFTIILLGESVVRVMHGMESQPDWSVAAATCAVGGLVVTFAIWWWYFDGVRGAAERHVRSAADAVRLRVWSYAHLPMYLAIAVGGVGLEHAVLVAEHEALHGGEVWLLATSLAVVMATVTTIYATTDVAQRQGRLLRRLAPHYALAAVAALSGLVGGHIAPPFFVLVLALLCAAQILLTFRAGERDAVHDALPELS